LHRVCRSDDEVQIPTKEFEEYFKPLGNEEISLAPFSWNEPFNTRFDEMKAYWDQYHQAEASINYPNMERYFPQNELPNPEDEDDEADDVDESLWRIPGTY
jgi:hypothetical protein